MRSLIQTFPTFSGAKDFGCLSYQRLKHRIPIRKPLLLVSQIQRSGGTLMSQLFDGHPQVYAQPGELNIGKPEKWNYPVLDPKEGPGRLFAVLKEKSVHHYARWGYQKQSDAQAKYDAAYRQRTKPFIFSMSLQKKLFGQFFEDFNAKTRRDILDAYVSSYFNAWLDYQDLYRSPDAVKYWCVFSARLAVHDDNAEAILRDYPEGKIVVMFRNPVSWYASAREHGRSYHDVEKSLSLWVRTYRNALRHHETFPSQILMVEFESLLRDVPGCMAKLCDHLGLQYSDSLCVPTFNRMPIESDSSFGAKEGIDTSAADRSLHVTDEERSQVEKLTAETYAQLKRVAL